VAHALAKLDLAGVSKKKKRKSTGPTAALPLYEVVSTAFQVSSGLGWTLFRLRTFLGQDVDLNQCRGFLIDGDYAVEWQRRTPSLNTRLSLLPMERSVCRESTTLHILFLLMLYIAGNTSFSFYTPAIFTVPQNAGATHSSR